MQTYRIGEPVALACQVRSTADDTLIPTATVVLHIQKPTSTSFQSHAITANGDGTFSASVTTDQVGVWRYRFTGTNPAFERIDSFNVADSLEAAPTPSGGVTIPLVSPSQDGLMSRGDKSKLDSVEVIAWTSAGRALATAANASAQRTALGLGTAALLDVEDLPSGGGGGGGPVDIEDVTGLQAALDAKADNAHTHSISQITDLQGELNAKAPNALVTSTRGATEAWMGPVYGQPSAAAAFRRIAEDDLHGLMAIRHRTRMVELIGLGRIPSTISVLQVHGYAAAGDCPTHRYMRRPRSDFAATSNLPQHTLYVLDPNGTDLWELAETEMTPEMAGGFGVRPGLVPTVDIGPAINACHDYLWFTHAGGFLRFQGDRYLLSSAVQCRPNTGWAGYGRGSGARNFDPAAQNANNPLWRPMILCEPTAAIRPASGWTCDDMTFWGSLSLNVAGWRAGLRHSRDLKNAASLIQFGSGIYSNQQGCRISYSVFFGFHRAISGTGCGTLRTEGCLFDVNHALDLSNVGERMAHDHLMCNAFTTQAAPLVQGHEDTVAIAFTAGALSSNGDGGTRITLPTAVDWAQKFYCIVTFSGLTPTSGTLTIRNRLLTADSVERINDTTFVLLNRTGDGGTWDPIAWDPVMATLSGTFLIAPWDDQFEQRITSIAQTPTGNLTRVTVARPFPPCTDPDAPDPNVPGWGWTITADKDDPTTILDGVYTGTRVVSRTVFDLPVAWNPAFASLPERRLALYPRMRMGADWNSDPSAAYRFINCDGNHIEFTQARGAKYTWYINSDNNKLIGCEQETGSTPGGAETAAGMLESAFPGSVGIYVGPNCNRFDAMTGHIKGAEISAEVEVTGNFHNTFTAVAFGSKVRLLNGRVEFVGCQLTNIEIGPNLDQALSNGGRRTGTVTGIDGFNPWLRYFESGVVTSRSGQLTAMTSGRNVDLVSRTIDGVAIGGMRTTNDGSFTLGARVDNAGLFRGGALRWDVSQNVPGYMIAVGTENEAQDEDNDYPAGWRFGLAAQWQSELIEGGPRASGTALLSCDSDAPDAVVVPLGTILRSTSGLMFATTVRAIVPSGGTASVAISAVAGGTDYNLSAGTVLTVPTRPSYIDASATIEAPGMAGGALGKATGNITITGTPGAVLPAGTSMTRPDNKAYQTTALATIGGGGTATVAIIATKGGTTYNAPSGRELTITSPPAGIDATAVIATGGLTGGVSGLAPGLRTVFGPASSLDTAISVVFERNGTIIKDGWTKEVLSVAVAPGDGILDMDFNAKNTDARNITYGSMLARVDDPTTGAEKGAIVFQVRDGVLLEDRLVLDADGTTISGEVSLTTSPPSDSNDLRVPSTAWVQEKISAVSAPANGVTYLGGGTVTFLI